MNAVSGFRYYGSNYNSLMSSFNKLATGNRINSAADDAANLAVSQKLQAQSNNYSTTVNNTLDEQSMANVKDGALQNITDNVQTIRQLALQASNGTYAAEDKSAIQKQINAIKSNVENIYSSTRYNGMAVFSKGDYAKLGIADLDVTGDFDIQKLDNAINSLSSSRSDIGASYNAMESYIKYASEANLNTIAAQSRIQDTDMALESVKMTRDRLLTAVQFSLQKTQLNLMKTNSLNLLNMLV